MAAKSRTAIVTGASQGIGAGAVNAFLERGYRVVANSRNITKSGAFAASDKLALVDGDIGDPATAAKIAETAVARFGTIDVLLNNAGIFFSKPFLEYTKADFESLIATNVAGFLYVTQRAIQQMLRAEFGRKHHQCHDDHGPTSDCRHPLRGADDHQRRARGGHSLPGHRIR